MKAVYAKVDGGAFTGFDDFFFHLLLHFGYYLFDTCRMDTSIGDELVKSQTADFATHGIEGADDDGFGRIVYHDFHAGSGFESADVAAFTTDDAAFHFIVVDVEDRHAILDGGFGGYALNGLNDDALGFLVGRHLGIVHDFVDIACGIGACLVLE